jgi:hypothetical protein
VSFGSNQDRPCLPVKHANLERYGDSAYRSVCPVCKIGVLLVMRHPITLTLLEKDRCTHCCQLFEYLDIRDLRRQEAANES